MKNKAKLVGYTVAEAMKELGVSDQQIYRWLDEGTLAELSVKGRARIVDAASVFELKRKRELAATD